jgi:hypothetical protein
MAVVYPPDHAPCPALKCLAHFIEGRGYGFRCPIHGDFLVIKFRRIGNESHMYHHNK